METPVQFNAMIIEDEAELCFLLSRVLKQKNIYALCANSIAEARKKIKRIKPSVVFLDNHLPDGFGLDFISQLRADFPSTKIIMMTAENSPQDISTAIEKGADYFISKPFNTVTIRNTIDSLQIGKTG